MHEIHSSQSDKQLTARLLKWSKRLLFPILVVLAILSHSNLFAALKTWDFSNAIEYTYDVGRVLVDAGVAKLKNYFSIINHDTQSEFSGTHELTSWQTNKVSIAPAYAPIIKTDGLMAYWPVDEGSGTTAKDIWGGYDAVVNSGMWVAGKFSNGQRRNNSGGSGTVDANAYLSKLTVRNQSKVSIAAWFKVDSYGSNNIVWIYNEACPAASSCTGQSRLAFYVDGSNGSLKLAGRVDDNTSASFAVSTVSAIPADGQWYHVAAVYDAGTDNHKIYKNGADVTSTQAAGNTFPNTDGDEIEFNSTSGSTPGDSSIDDILFFHGRTLTGAEVLALATANRAMGVPRTIDSAKDIPGIIFYEGFDEGSGTTVADDLASLTGTFSGSPAWIQGTHEGTYAIRLAPADEINYGDTSLLDNLAQVTFSFWVRSNETNSDGRAIMNKGADNPNDVFAFRTGSPNEYLYFELQRADLVKVTVTSTQQVEDIGIWHHFVGTWDGQYVRLYVDGSETGTAQALSGGALNSGTAALTLGAAGDSLDASYDDWAIYNRALSASEIQALYHGTRGRYTSAAVDSGEVAPVWESLKVTKSFPWGEALEKPPLHYFRFDEGSGLTAANAVSGGPGIVLTGGLWQEGNTRVLFPNTRSFYFDGVDDTGTISESGFPPTNYTISAWIRPANVSSNQAIFGKYGAGVGIYLTSAGNFRHHVLTGGCNTTTGTTAAVAGTWYHVAISRGVDNNLMLYVNGIAEGTPGNASGFFSSTDTTWDVASTTSCGGNTYATPFSGHLDEIMISDRELPYDEILALSSGAKRPRMQADNYEKNIVGLWHLDNDALDDAGTAAGTLNGGVQFQGALQSPAILLDGSDDSVSIADQSILSPSAKPWAVSAWIRTKTVSTAIASKGTSGTNGYELGLDASGKLVFKKGAVTLTGNTVLTDGQWHHVVGTSNASGNMFVYVDGAQDNSNANTAGYTSQSDTLYIGRNNAGAYFNGQIDEVALFNVNLTSAQVLDIYKRGAGQIRFQVRTDSDAGMATNVSSWSGGGVPNKGPVAVWHFNEGSGTSFADSTSNANSGSCTTCPAWLDGKISKGIDFGSVDHTKFISIPDSASLDVSAYTLTGWLNPSEDSGFRTILFSDTNLLVNYGTHAVCPTPGTLMVGRPSINGNPVCSTNLIPKGTWSHFAVAFDGSSNVKIYVNGVLDTSTGVNTNLPADSSAARRIGNNDILNWSYRGQMDELALYSRALSGPEIWKLYESSLYAASPDGNFLHGIRKHQYLQYRADFVSIDEVLAPDVQSVMIDMSGSYPKDNPTIETNTGQALNYLNGFTANETLNGQAIQYILSPNNGTSWYYWNGSAWTNTAGTNYSESATASVINTNAASFDDWMYGYGFSNLTLKVRAFLNSDGTATPELSNLDVDYGSATVTLDYPNGGETLKANSTKAILWTPTGSLPTANQTYTIEYSTDGLNYTNNIASAAKDNHNEEFLTGALSVWHMDAAAPTADSKGTSTLTLIGNAAGSSASYKFGGGSILFDGSGDKINAGSAAALDNMGPLTWSVWLNPQPRAATDKIFEKGVKEYNLRSDNTFQFYVQDTGSPAYMSATTSQAISNNVWTHVLVTWDGSLQYSNVKFYYDGTLVATGGSNGAGAPRDDSANNLYIGGDSGSALYDYPGYMDEIALFNRVLNDSEIAFLASNNLGYLWSVPNITNNTVTVRIRSNAVPGVRDTSAGNFTIANLDLTSPNGAEQWQVNRPYSITWTPTSYVPNDLILEYTTNGTGWTNIASNVTVAGVNPPDANSIGGLIGWWHLDEPSGALVDSKSGNSGSFVGGAVSTLDGAFNRAVDLTASGGDYVDLGSPAALDNLPILSYSAWIKPQYAGADDTDHVIVAKNNFRSFHLRENPANTYNQLVFGYASSNYSRYPSVSGAIQPGVWAHVGVSWDGSFTGSAANLYVNGVLLTGGSSNSGAGGGDDSASNMAIGTGVEGNFRGIIDEVAIYNTALTAGNMVTLATRGNSYTWTVPIGAVGTTIKVRARSASAAEMDDQSNANFTVGQLDITSPNGSEYWTVGSVQSITWTSTGLPNSPGAVKLEYSIDGGSSWVGTPIAASTANDGTHSWTIPDNVSTNTMVRITSLDTGFTQFADTSDASFTIPKIVVTSPNAGTEQWQVGTLRNITWTADQGTPADLVIEYSSDAPHSVWSNIASDVGSPKSIANHTLYLPFNETSGTSADDKSGVNDGTLNNGAKFAPGIYGNAVSLDGVNDTVTGASTGLSSSSPFTASMWIKRTNSPGSVWPIGTFSTGALYLEENGGSYRPAFYISGNGYSRNTNGNVTLNSWHHLAMTHDNGSVQEFYIDGVKLTNSADITFTTAASSYQIGPGGLLTSTLMQGQIDELAFYSRVLTASEILKLAVKPSEFGKGIDPTGISGSVAGIWHLDNAGTEASGSGASALSLSSSPYYIYPGKLGYAMQFDGVDDRASITSIPAGTTARSWSFWMKSPSKMSYTGMMVQTDTSDWINFVTAGSSSGGVQVYDNVNSCNTATSVISFEQWAHVAVTHTSSGPSTKVYVNGVESASCSTLSLALNSTSMWLGRRTDNSSPFEGALDEMAVYNKVLSAAEVAQLAGLTSYQWTVPDFSSSTVKVRVRSASVAALTDDSDADFKVEKLRVTYPSGGSLLPRKSAINATINLNYTWETGASPVVPSLDMDFSGDGGVNYTSSITGTPNDGLSNRDMAAFPSASKDFKIRLSGANPDTGFIDDSDYSSSIIDIDLTAPSGGDHWQVGTERYITWNTNGTNIPNDLIIEYDLDGNFATTGDTTAISSTTGFYNSPKAISNLVSYWMFDSATVDAAGVLQTSAANSGGGNTMTLTNGARFVPGQFGNAVYFDRVNDYISGSDAGLPTGTSARSFSAWIKSSNTCNQTIFMYGTNNPQWTINCAGGGQLTYWDSVIGSFSGATAVGDNQWHHVALTHDGVNAQKMYVDGKLDGTGALSFTTALNGTARIGGTTWYFSGLIDDFAVYNKVLSAQEVATLALTSSLHGKGIDPANANQTNVVGIWHLDGNANDSSPNGYNGNLVGDAAYSSGILGQAITLDGTGDEVTIANQADFDILAGQSMTVSAWAYDTRTKFVPLNIEPCVVAIGQSPVNPPIYGICRNASAIWYLESYTESFDSSTPVPYATWQHIAAVFDRSNQQLRLYVDGVLAATDTDISAQTWDLSHPLKIGYGGWTGKIDEVAMFKRALTPAEILHLAGKAAYKWTIPDLTTSTIKLRVRSNSLAGLIDESNTAFTIEELQITAPNGNELWPAGSAQDITWTTNGSIANVKIEYTTNDSTYNPVNETEDTTNDGIVANDGSFTWTVPNTTTQNLRIRITGDPQNGFTDSSDLVLSIIDADIALPNGTEQWQVGSLQNITWTQSTGAPNDLYLEYSTDAPHSVWSPVSPQIDMSPKSISGHVGYWPFNEMTGTNADDKSSTNDVTLVNGAKFAPGVFGNAISFDGVNDYATHADGASFSPESGDITISAWVYYTGLPVNDAGDTRSRNIWHNTGTGDTLSLRRDYTQSKFVMEVSDASTGSSSATGTTVLSTGVWYHVLGIKRGNTADIYVNGHLENSNTGALAGAVSVSAGSAPVIGGGTGQPMDGKIDEVAVYNRALTGSEVAKLAVAPAIMGKGMDASAISGATAVWHFDGGTDGPILNGVTAGLTDAVGGDDNGTAVNANGSGMTWTTGKMGGAVSFDESGDYITIPDSAAVSPTTALTMAVWIKTSTTQANTDIIEHGSTYGFYLHSNPSIGFYVYDSVGTIDSFVHSYNYANNAWQHIAFTFDGDIMRVYINGANVYNRDTALTSIRNLGNALRISTGSFIGSLDEPAIYNRALSANEVAQLAGLASYYWTVPDAASNTVKIRVKSTLVTDLMDESNADFKIEKLQVQVPNGAEFWPESTVNTITWLTGGSAANVKIEYTTNGTVFTPIQESEGTQNDGIVANDGSFDWTVPNVISQTVKIRITGADAGTTSFTDLSDGEFSIIDANIVAANGAEQWQVGSIQNITWTQANGVPNDLLLEYSTDAPHSVWTAVSPQIDLSPKAISGHVAYWPFNETTGTNADDKSSTNDVTLAGGAKFAPGLFGNAILFDGTDDYASSPTGILNLGASVSTVSFWVKLNSLQDYAVLFAQSSGGGANQSLRIVSDDGNILVSDTSTVISSGTPIDTAWHHIGFTYSSGTGTLYIDGVLRSSGALNFSGLAGTPAFNIGRSAITLPYHVDGLIDEVAVYNRALTASEIALLALSPSQMGLGIDPASVTGSTALFHFDNAVYSTSAPTDSSGNNITASIFGNTTYRKGILGNALTLDGSGDYVTLPDSAFLTPGAGDFSLGLWFNLPNKVPVNEFYYDNTLQFHVYNGFVRAGVNDGEGDSFFIQGAIPVNNDVWTHAMIVKKGTNLKLYVNGVLDNQQDQPLFGTAAMAGTAYVGALNATTYNMAGKLDELVFYNGKALTPSEVALLAGKASYLWTVPDVSSNTVKVRLRSTLAAALTDDSAADFKIEKLQVTSPNGAEIWPEGTVHNIAWQTGGTAANVKIEYTINDTVFTPVQESEGTPDDGVVANDGSFSWTIPNVISQTVQIRITGSDAGTTSFMDISDSVFSIIDANITSPNGSETFRVGSVRNISWTQTQGAPLDMILEYSTDAPHSNWTPVSPQIDMSPKSIANHIGYWPFDEMQGATADNAEGTAARDMALVNGPKFVPGIFGNAVYFDGVNDSATLANLPTGANVTYSGWVNYLSTGSDGNIIWTGAYGLKFQGAGDRRIRFAYNNQSLDSINSVALNVWTHLAATYDGTTGRIYINGVLDNAAAMTAGTTPATIPLGQSTTGRTFALDDLAIYDRALSAGEIAQLALSPAQRGLSPITDSAATLAVITSPQAIYHFNEALGTNTTSADSSGTAASNATLSGGALITTGLFGHSVYFDGVNDQASITAIPASSTRSWSMWVKQTVHNTSATSVIMNNGAMLYLPSFNNKIRLGGSGFVQETESVSDFPVGTWTHLAATYDNASQTSMLYINGSLDSSATPKPLTTTTTMTLGSLASANYFQGQIDEAAVYNRVLTPGEIKVLAGKSSYSWTVPNTVSSTSKVRVRSAAVAADLTDDSANNFNIARLDITAPNTATTLRMGATANNITWNSAGSIPTDFVLEFSRDADHAVWEQVSGATGIDAIGTTSYNWTPIPSYAVEQATTKVRIRSTTVPDWMDESNVNFTIGRPIITFTAPVSSSVWPFDVNQTITWTHDAATQGTLSDDLKIEYSTDDGVSWPGGSQIITGGSTDYGAPVVSGVTWFVPQAAVSTTVKMRITDNVYPYGEAISQTFKVTGSFRVLKPNGNEKWAVNFPHNITWQTSGNIIDVRIILYDTDPNAPVLDITAGEPGGKTPSDGIFSWTPLPAHARTGLKMRIMDFADQDVYDDSDANFIVSNVAVTEDIPARLLAGANRVVNWTHTGISNINLQYSLAGTFADAVNIAGCQNIPAANLTCSFTLPQVTTRNFRIRAVDADVPGVGDTNLAVDTNDAALTVYGTVLVTAPVGGAVWSSGQPNTITWTIAPADANVIPSIKIMAAKNGNFNDNTGGNIVTIVNSTPGHNVSAGNGSYVWTPQATSNGIRVRVMDADYAGTQENQDQKTSASFTIAGISIINPTGGETVLVNDSMSIVFDQTGSVTDADFHYSPDGGTTWKNMTLAEDADGLAVPVVSQTNNTFSWTPIPDDISTNTIIRIRDANQNSTYALSPAFNVKGVLTMNTPPALTVGAAHTIQWSNTGSIPEVRIQYSKSGLFNGDEVLIADLTGLSGGMTPQNQTFDWTPIPDIIAMTNRIRITDTSTHVNGSLATTVTSGAFNVIPSITITSPIVSSVWGVQDSLRDITWTTVGTVSNLKIEYVPVQGTQNNQAFQIFASTANDGAELWPSIPDIVTNGGQNPNADGDADGNSDGDRDIQLKIRITDNNTLNAGHPTTVVESPVFTVKWYEVEWKVKDLDQASLIQNFGVVDSSGWNVGTDTLTQITGVVRRYKAGTYTSTFSKSGYASATDDTWAIGVDPDVNDDIDIDEDQARTVFMQNDATASVEVNVKVQYNYDLTSDTFNFTWWVEKGGILQTNENVLFSGKIEIYENGSTTLLRTLNDADGANTNGLYEAVWASSGIDTDNLYFAKATVAFGNASAFKTSGVTIDVRERAELQQVNTNVLAVQTQTASINTKIGDVTDTETTSSLFGKIASLKEVVGEITDTAAEDSLYGKITDSQEKTVTILDEVKTNLPKIIKDEIAKGSGSRGRMLMRNPKVGIGETISLRFQDTTGKVPTINIYDPNDKLIINNAPMKEVGTTGIYSYDFKALPVYAKGEYTVIVKETTSGFMDSMQLQVVALSATDERMSASIGSAASSAEKASSEAKKAYDEVSGLRDLLGAGETEGGGISKQLTEISGLMNRVKNSLVVLTGDAALGANEQPITIQSVHSAVLGVMDEIRNVASREGVNLDSVYDTVAEQKETTQDIQNMVVATEAAAKTTREILEKAQDSPVVSSWFEKI